ncbi:MAG: DUF2232 domain-containing protein [Coriobacteriia bacterium]
MTVRPMTIAEAVPLMVASMLGMALSPVFPYIFLPIAAAGLSGLIFRGRLPLAACAALLGAAGVAVFDPTTIAFVFPVAIALVAAIVLLAKGRNVQGVTAGLIAVIGGGWIASAAIAARAIGTTLPALWNDAIKSIIEEAQTTLGAAASESTIAQLQSWMELLASTWPATYMILGIITAVFVVTTIAWSGRRSPIALDVPLLTRLDLTAHVLWPLIAGVLLVAASYAKVSSAALLGAIGLNLLLCARMFFLFQGLGVMTAVLEKLQVTRTGRVLGIFGFVILDVLTFAVSFTGLVDFWFNFRRLPRDGFTPATAEDHTPDR